MPAHLLDRIERAIGRRPNGLTPLHGGCVAEVYRADLPGEPPVVVKVADGPGAALSLEAYMLEYLACHSSLPVPHVLAASDDLLVMEHVDGRAWSGGDERVEHHAAELLAALHEVRGRAFGFERDTLIGGLPQPCPWTDSWIGFFGEHRLLHMARQARDAGRLSPATVGRVERLVGRLDRWVTPPAFPSLIHGDVWSGNVLARDGRIAAFLDPAIYFADPEIELAFITLFNCFGEPFFERYRSRRPIRDGFFEVRRDLYNLYPLLVHARLFGGSYAAAVERTLSRFGV